MGIHDREYYRDENAPGINLGGEWSIVAKLIVVNAVVYIADMFTHGLMDSLAAGPESIAKPWMCWQLLTYAFAHATPGFNHIFWNMFGLWVFGRDIEDRYGKKEFLWMYLVAAVLGGLLFSLRCMAVYDYDSWSLPSVRGASGAVTTVTILYCLHFPKRTILLMMILPVPAWVVGVLIVGGNMMMMFSSAAPVAFDVHLVGAVFAIAYFKFGWRVSAWVPGLRLPKVNRSSKLKIHDPKEDYTDLDVEGDRLLQKVSNEGMDSLTRAEQRKLEAYSRRMKQKHR
jgi:membrane associated rhomboid family serine protease